MWSFDDLICGMQVNFTVVRTSLWWAKGHYLTSFSQIWINCNKEYFRKEVWTDFSLIMCNVIVGVLLYLCHIQWFCFYRCVVYASIACSAGQNELLWLWLHHEILDVILHSGYKSILVLLILHYSYSGFPTIWNISPTDVRSSCSHRIHWNLKLKRCSFAMALILMMISWWLLWHGMQKSCMYSL